MKEMTDEEYFTFNLIMDNYFTNGSFDNDITDEDKLMIDKVEQKYSTEISGVKLIMIQIPDFAILPLGKKRSISYKLVVDLSLVTSLNDIIKGAIINDEKISMEALVNSKKVYQRILVYILSLTQKDLEEIILPKEVEEFRNTIMCLETALSKDSYKNIYEKIDIPNKITYADIKGENKPIKK